MSAVIEQVQATAVDQPRPQQRQSLIAKFASKLSVEPAKLMNALRNVAFRQRDGEVVTDEQLMALLIVADRYGLDPFLKEIYAFADKGSIIPVVGVDGWVSMVQDRDEYDGEEFEYGPLDKNGLPEWIECVMHRKDRTRPTRVREYMAECRRSTGPWGQSPRRMLRHRAYIQCARVAFGFSGISDQDEAERIIEGEVRVVSSGGGDPLADLDARAAARKAAPALEQSQPVTIEAQASRKEPEPVEAKHAAAADAASPKGDATPDSGPADSASSDSGGGAPAADAPASHASDDAAPRVSYAQLEERLRKAPTLDALDEAAPLIQTFGKRDATDLSKVYRERRAQLESAAG